MRFESALTVCDEVIVDAHRASLAKLDIGKGCIRFKAAADLPLDMVRKMLTEAVNRRKGNSVKLLPKRPKRA